MAKLAGYGLIIKKGATAIAAVQDVSGPGLEVGEIDVTSHDSASAIREFVMGLIDFGEITFNIVWDPSNATHIALRTDLIARTSATYHVIWPEAASPEDWAFSAWVKAIVPSAPVDGALTMAVTLRPTGALTVT